MPKTCPYCQNSVVETDDVAYVNGIRAVGPQSCEFCKPKRMCVACGKRPAATDPDWPALCEPCLERAGESITAGANVVCRVEEAGNGTVERIDGDLAVVRTADGRDAWLPIPDLVRVG